MCSWLQLQWLCLWESYSVVQRKNPSRHRVKLQSHMRSTAPHSATAILSFYWIRAMLVLLRHRLNHMDFLLSLLVACSPSCMNNGTCTPNGCSCTSNSWTGSYCQIREEELSYKLRLAKNVVLILSRVYHRLPEWRNLYCSSELHLSSALHRSIL